MARAQDPGVHKFDADNHKEMKFVNLSSSGCVAASAMAISARSMHGYVQCFR